MERERYWVQQIRGTHREREAVSCLYNVQFQMVFIGKKKVHQRGFILGENIRAHAVRLGFDADTFRDPRRLARQDCEAV